MGLKINFDTAGNPELPTLLLARHNGDIIGQLLSEDLVCTDSFSDYPSASFKIHKTLNGKKNPYWHQIKNFRRVLWKESNLWFELKCELNEDIETVMTCYLTHLGKAELSQVSLYGFEVNTENDIARDDYKNPTLLYKENEQEASLIHRILKYAPNYEIGHVDSTIANIQRTFSFDKISIIDAFSQIEQEINCKFIISCTSTEDNLIKRVISIYDMNHTCKDCGYRGEYINVCPKCGSTDIIEPFGKDTTVYVTSDVLAETLQLTSDTDSFKNCFKLEAGDDLMTATIRNINPNGTDFMWRISDDDKDDMSDELVDKIEEYDKQYKYYQNEYEIPLNQTLLNKYNHLIDKYSVYNTDLNKTSSPIIGYTALINAYYDTIDLNVYLQSSLMPDVRMDDTSAEIEAGKLNEKNISTVSLEKLETLSQATADSVVLSMAKVIVDSRYQVKVNSSSIQQSTYNWIWTGNFKITNYSDEDDMAISSTISITVDDDFENFTKQKIEKTLSKQDDTDYSISGIMKYDYDKFVSEMKKYCLDSLVSFRESCQACIDILVEQGISDNQTWSGKDPNLYNDLYLPYYNKLQALESEIKVREEEINIITGTKDVDGNILTEGIQNQIIFQKNQIQSVLNFESFLGTELWREFLSYRRESVFSNDNYVSDGLTNEEIFKKAMEFLESAEKEIYKASQIQHTISSSLVNLFSIKEFEPLWDMFEVGNWIRVLIDEQIYKIRLLEYQIDFKDFTKLGSVSFSDVAKIKNGETDVESILKRAQSTSTSYDYVKRQAEQGSKSNSILSNWFENGLSATNTKIISGADGQEQIWDSHGMLFQKYDSITGTYSPVKFKFINSCLVLTTDNFKTTKAAFGEFQYQDPRTGEIITAYGVNGELIVGNLVIGKYLSFYNESNTLIFDTNGLQVSNDVTSITISPNASSLFSITKLSDKSNLIQVTKDGNLAIVGDITARSLTLLDNTTIDGNHITGLSTVATSGKYSDLVDAPKLDLYMQTDKTIGQTPKDGSTGFSVSSSGLLQASNAVVYGSLYSSNGTIGGWNIGNGYLRYKDSENYYSGMGASGVTSAFYAGGTNVNGSDAKFRVEHNGSLFAEDATITGNVTAKNCKIQDSLYFYVNGYGSDSYGKLMYLETPDDGGGLSNSYVDLIVGKTLGARLADNANVTKSLNFGRVVVPGTLLVGDNKMDVVETISSLERQISSLEDRIKELEG